jgi:hypothetical protein
MANKLSKAEHADHRKHYESVQRELLRRVQDCLAPQYAIRWATLKLKLANELADLALERLDRVATDQANVVELQKEEMTVSMLLAQLDDCGSVEEMNVKRKQIRRVLDNPIFNLIF